MLAWRLKWSLNGDRSDFQVNILSGVCFCSGLHKPRAAARAAAFGAPELYFPEYESRHAGLETKVVP